MRQQNSRDSDAAVMVITGLTVLICLLRCIIKAVYVKVSVLLIILFKIY